MIKVFLLLFLIGYLPDSTWAQRSGKPIIDTAILGNWPMPERPLLSPDGCYAAYRIINSTPGSCSMIVESTSKERWQKEILCTDRFDPYFFSSDNRRLIYKSKDTLFYLQLGSDEIDTVAGVVSFLTPGGWLAEITKGDWLAYLLKGHEKVLVIQQLSGNQVLQLSSVESYMFSNNGSSLLVICTNKLVNDGFRTLYWIDLTSSLENREIWSGMGLGEKLFSLDGTQMAFVVTVQNHKSVWYYRVGMQQAIVKVDSNTMGMDAGLQIKGRLSFSLNNQWLFFEMMQPESRKLGSETDQVDVWSYRDMVLQPRQLYEQQLGEAEKYLGVINIASNLVRRLEYGEDRVLYIGTAGGYGIGDYVVVQKNASREYWWPHDSGALQLVSLKDGRQKTLAENGSFCSFHAFSPGGKYFMFWDIERKGYYSYNFETEKLVNTTKGIPGGVSQEYPSGATNYPELIPMGWYQEDTAFLFCDSYDIWKLDPAGKLTPLNITRGYGRKHRVRFRLVNEEESYLIRKQVYANNDTLLLTALDMQSKYNGFYRLRLDNQSVPEKLIMGPYTFYKTSSQKPHPYSLREGMKPVRALNADCWIVERNSATEAPNYYFTRDFKQFMALSHLTPQLAYNWLTVELVKWKLPNGGECHGVLYKPEDFDSRKKYPMIFNYYMKLSHRLYEFPYPQYTASNINIPWFVSRGYLVFTPDIHYRVGSQSGKTTGESALDAVVSAAKHLSKLPFVDNSRMAIQGHSFGGGETNYIITHTKIFAAAAEAAGDSDPFMSYLTLVPLLGDTEWFSKQEGAEVGQGFRGRNATPWKFPELYRRNSALLNADKTTTPLLIMHNKMDNQISFRQGVAMYLALRRLGKPVWMLQYDGASHNAGAGSKDFTIRLTQFFDHYLKEIPAPRWMTLGIPAELKGIENRYELDPLNFCGINCRICKTSLRVHKNDLR